MIHSYGAGLLKNLFLNFNPYIVAISIQFRCFYCLEHGKIDALKMLDLQTKSTIKLDNLQM